MHDSKGPASASGNVPFPSTLWSEVVSAGGGSRRALNDLAARYWRPVYSYFRQAGSQPNDAADLTQVFFISVLEGKILQVADRSRGRFRKFLLTCLKNFLSNEFDRAQALKRGGGMKILSLDVENAERTLGTAATEDPDREFERQWAAEVVGRAVDRLKKELQPPASEIFSQVHNGKGTTYAEIGRRAGMKEDAIAQSIHRSRERLREILKEEIGDTVGSPDEVAAEMKDLMRALSSSGPPEKGLL